MCLPLRQDAIVFEDEPLQLRVHHGWGAMYRTIKKDIRQAWQDLKQAHPEADTEIIGWSLGSGQAILCCQDLNYNFGVKPHLFTFGSVRPFKSVPTNAQRMRRYLDWSVKTALASPNVTVHMETAATPELVKAERPDAVIVACGAKPILPTFTASGTDKIVWVGDAESGKATLGDRIVVAGAGFTGMEFALAQVREGKKVTVVDMLPMDRIGQGGSAINLICLKDLLAKAEVEFRCSCRIEDITQQGVILTDEAGQRQEIACDNAVLSLGFRPDRAFTDSFAGTAREVYVVGDADRVANVWQANTTAFDKAMRI